MGLVLLCIIWLITFFVTTYFFAAKRGGYRRGQRQPWQVALTYVVMGIVLCAGAVRPRLSCLEAP
jgi:hypothetical protein